MKSRIIFAILLLINGLAHAQQTRSTPNFTLHGTVTGKAKKIILSYPDISEQRRTYTVPVKKGHFMFKGYINSPVYAMIENDIRPPHPSNAVELFLSPGNMTISLRQDHFDEAKITGSPTQDEFYKLQEIEKPINKITLDLLHKEFEISKGGNTPKNHAAVEVIGSKIDSYDRQKDQIDYHYITGHPQSYLSAFLLRNFALGDMRLDSIEKPYNSFTEAVKNSASGTATKKIIGYRKAASVGTILQMPAGVNFDGSRFNTRSFNVRNYALLYFWADWGNDNDHLKQLYNCYQPKGLNVLAISMARFKNMWRDSVKKNRITLWHNILSDPVGNLDTFYNIREMAPSMILLINKDHKVIGRYRGTSTLYKRDYQEGSLNDLDKKLAELYRN